MLSRLPLNGLRCFEAAARHMSFKLAAGELFVTPAAISQQIKALEEQHKTLKNAWSDIVRTNLLKVDELKKELETKRAKRDSIRDALAAARSTGAATHDRLVAELCSAKVEVAELNERRDRARKKLGEEARTLVGL